MYSQSEPIQIEAINAAHLCDRFSSGERTEDHFLRHYALVHQDKQIARTYVACDDDYSVLGFYTLSTASIEFEQLDAKTARRLPCYPVAAAMISHLAVDNRNRAHNVADKLLLDALTRIINVQTTLLLNAVVVVAPDNVTTALYLRFGFIKFPGQSDTLFLPMDTIQRALR